MATIYAYSSNNNYLEYTMSMSRSGTTVTITVNGTVYNVSGSAHSSSSAKLFVQVRHSVSPSNTSGTTTYTSDYGTLLTSDGWSSSTVVSGFSGSTNTICKIADNNNSNFPNIDATGFPTGGRSFTITLTKTSGAAVSLSNVSLFLFRDQTSTTAPSSSTTKVLTFIGKKSTSSPSLSGNKIRYVTQNLSVAAATYTISYNKGSNGTGTNTTDTKTHGTALTLKGAIFTRTGHYQSGWATSDGGAQAYALSASYTANAAVTLYPVWTAYQLTVQYNANGGTITTGTGATRYRVSSNIVQRSQDSGSTWATLALTSGSQDNWNLHNLVNTTSYDGGIKRTGYHVVTTEEFNTNAAGTGNTINMENGDTNAATIYRMNGNAYLTADKTISLYVKWVADTYTISYNKGANGTGTNTTDTKTYGVALTLKGAIFTRTGYTQTGWSTTDGGAKVYDLSASYTTNAATTLYPYWTINTWTVGYNANGHGTAPASQTKTYNVALTLQPFISNVNGTTSTVTITGNNQNGDSWSGSNGSATWCPVYSQTYWNTNNSGTGTNYSSGGSYTANAGTTLYAIWETTNTGTGYVLPTGTPVKNSTTTNTLTVSYNANGGSSTPSSQTSSKTVTYSFKGWFTAASGGTQRTTSSRVTAAETVYSQFNSTTGSQAAITLRAAITHANTTPTTYTVTFNANGGSSTKTSQSAAVTRTWAFNGWHEGSASGTSHAASSSFTPSVNVTMYAGWDTSDSTASVTLPTAAQCTRTGYTLLGFSTSSTATTATYAPGATYTPAATIELFAVWERNDIVKIYTGTQWVLAPSYIYKNGAWTQFTVIKIYDGSQWKEL